MLTPYISWYYLIWHLRTGLFVDFEKRAAFTHIMDRFNLLIRPSRKLGFHWRVVKSSLPIRALAADGIVDESSMFNTELGNETHIDNNHHVFMSTFYHQSNSGAVSGSPFFRPGAKVSPESAPGAFSSPGGSLTSSHSPKAPEPSIPVMPPAA